MTLKDEGAEVAEARGAALEKARPTLDDLGISEPADLIALNGDGEPGDGLTLDFGAVGYLPGELQGSYRLALDIFEAGSPQDCLAYMGEEPKGFALRLEGDAERELHRDGPTLPASRGCPLTYRIYAVVARPGTASLEDGVAIVSVYPFGFEGPDRRFLAVPLGE